MLTFILFGMLLIIFGGLSNPNRVYHGTNTPPKEAPTRRPSSVVYSKDKEE